MQYLDIEAKESDASVFERTPSPPYSQSSGVESDPGLGDLPSPVDWTVDENQCLEGTGPISPPRLNSAPVRPQMDVGADGARKGPAKNKNPKFRVNAKCFALTYPKCCASKELICEALVGMHNPVRVIVSEEKHEDGSPHIHAMVLYTIKKNIKDSRHFDIGGFHCNIQGVKCREDWEHYIKKDDNWVAYEKGFDPDDYAIGKKRKSFEDLEWVKQFRQLHSVKAIVWPVSMGIVTMNIPDAKLKKRHAWICGPPDTGKTYWMNLCFKDQKVFVPANTEYPFENYNDEDLIVYDDKIPKFEEIASVTNTYFVNTPIFGKVRYQTKYWKCGHARNVIVLSNKEMQCVYLDKEKDAMISRFNEVNNIDWITSYIASYLSA